MYINIWVIAQIPTIGSARYFIIYVGDFSRNT